MEVPWETPHPEHHLVTAPVSSASPPPTPLRSVGPADLGDGREWSKSDAEQVEGIANTERPGWFKPILLF